MDRPAAGQLAARDPVSIAAAIRHILSNPPTQADVRTVAERFTWDANMDALYDHMTGLIRA